MSASGVSMVINWQLNLTGDEVALVLRALGGRLKDEEDAKAAKELGDKFTAQRCSASKSVADSMERNFQAMVREREDK